MLQESSLDGLVLRTWKIIGEFIAGIWGILGEFTGGDSGNKGERELRIGYLERLAELFRHSFATTRSMIKT